MRTSRQASSDCPKNHRHKLFRLTTAILLLHKHVQGESSVLGLGEHDHGWYNSSSSPHDMGVPREEDHSQRNGDALTFGASHTPVTTTTNTIHSTKITPVAAPVLVSTPSYRQRALDQSSSSIRWKSDDELEQYVSRENSLYGTDNNMFNDPDNKNVEEEQLVENFWQGSIRQLRNLVGPHAARTALASSDEDDDTKWPIAYRYYGRKFARPPSAGSVPVLMWGPNADHWKVTAQQLQQKGFSVIACERVVGHEESRTRSTTTSRSSTMSGAFAPASEEDEDSTATDEEMLVSLMLRLMDNLRWQNVLLVACDDESLSAVQVALQLAPERIAGLVLCGNLSPVYKALASGSASSGLLQYGLDNFLEQILDCPFMIVWNGDTSDETKGGARGGTFGDAIEEGMMDTDTSRWTSSHRSLILGGGMAPHRRRPEQLAWVITRFVEEHLAAPRRPSQRQSLAAPHKPPKQEENQDNRIKLPLGLDVVFSQEFFVVVGRLLASGIAYGMALHVGLYQYRSFQSGIFDFQTRLNDLLRAPGRLFSTFLGACRWVPRAAGLLFGNSSSPKEGMDSEPRASSESHRDGNSPDLNQTDTDDGQNGEEHDEDSEDEGPVVEDDPQSYGPLFFLDKVIV